MLQQGETCRLGRGCGLKLSVDFDSHGVEDQNDYEHTNILVPRTSPMHRGLVAARMNPACRAGHIPGTMRF